MSITTEKRSAAPEENKLKILIAPDIRTVEKTMQADISSISGRMDGLLLEVLQYGLFNGGKRFRPLLAVLAARLSGNNDADVYRLAIAFEYLHMATLFHDDVIDNAQNRRGKPAVFRAYGQAAAILAGDFLHARSMALVGELGGVEALKIFCKATSGMVDGEFLQLRNAANFNQSEEDYFAAVSGKTVLLISAAMEIGSLFGGGNNTVRKALLRYGNNLGCAFQIVDDLLDYLGDQKVTGKSVGNDLVEGKMTLPLILALKKAEQKEWQYFQNILQDADARKNSYHEIKNFITKYNGFTDAMIKAEELIAEAISELGIFGLPEQQEDRRVLEGLARYVLTRTK
jgi:octaprenyl-diphosphate synthase